MSGYKPVIPNFNKTSSTLLNYPFDKMASNMLAECCTVPLRHEGDAKGTMINIDKSMAKSFHLCYKIH